MFGSLFTKLLYFELWEPGAAEPGASYKNRWLQNPVQKLDFMPLKKYIYFRVINRAPGLKLVVQTLLSSLKPIGNIVLICCTFFIIFGILGVQLFKVNFRIRQITKKYAEFFFTVLAVCLTNSEILLSDALLRF